MRYLLAIVTLLVVLSSHAYAGGGNHIIFKIADSNYQTDFYKESMSIGESKSFIFIVENPRSTSVELTIYPSDILTAVGGGEARQDVGEVPKLAGSWVKERSQQFGLEPNESRKFVFNVTVPLGTQAGQYYIGIILAETVNTGGNTSLIRIGLPIEININKADARHELEIVSFGKELTSDGSYILSAGISNLGTILERPTVNLKVVAKNGEGIYEGTIQSGSIFSATTGQLNFVTNKTIPNGNYRAIVEANYSDNIVARREFDFSVEKKEEEEADRGRDLRSKVDQAEGKESPTHRPTGWHTFKSNWYLYLIIIFLLLLLFWRRKKKKKGEEKE